LPSAAARALLDRYRRWQSEDRIDVRTRRGLYERTCVRVQRLEVAALAFVEKNVERERALAAAGNAGDDCEAIARDARVDVLQVVLARVMNTDGVVHFLGALRRAQRERSFFNTLVLSLSKDARHVLRVVAQRF